MKLSSLTKFFIIIFAIALGGTSFWFSAKTSFSEAHLKSAKQNSEAGKFEQALADINQATKLFPTNALFYREQALLYYYYSPPKARLIATAAMRKAIALNPQKGDFYYTLGAIYTVFNRTLKAELAFENALAIQRDHMSYRLGLAKLYLVSKRWDKGFHLYRETLTLAPKSRLQREAGNQFFYIAELLSKNELIYFWPRVLSLPLENADAEKVLETLTKIGENFIENEDPFKALIFYEQIINLDPYYTSSRNELLAQMLTIAHELRKSQEYAKAAEAYEKILALLPTKDSEFELLEQRYRLVALLNLGISERRLDNFAKATRIFEEVLNLAPPESDKDFELNHRKAALQQLINLKDNVQ